MCESMHGVLRRVSPSFVLVLFGFGGAQEQALFTRFTRPWRWSLPVLCVLFFGLVFPLFGFGDAQEQARLLLLVVPCSGCFPSLFAWYSSSPIFLGAPELVPY